MEEDADMKRISNIVFAKSSDHVTSTVRPSPGGSVLYQHGKSMIIVPARPSLYSQRPDSRTLQLPTHSGRFPQGIQAEPDETTKSVQADNIGYYPSFPIGTGATGTVYRGYFGKHPAKKPAAVKGLMEQSYELYENEIRILNQLNHQNIVRYFHTTRSDVLYLIAMELAVCDADRYLRDNNPPLDEISRYICQVLDGLACMHGKNILHRDIKPSNVLLFPLGNDRMIAKLSDFGISKELCTNQSESTAKGTQLFMSPECFRAYESNTTFESTKASDIFSLGSTIFYFLTKEHPCGKGDRIIMNNLNAGKLMLEPSTRIPEHIPYFHLLQHMLVNEPSKRIPIKAIVRGRQKGHPCLWKTRQSLEFIKEACTFLKSPKGQIIETQMDGMLGPLEWKSQLCDKVQDYFMTTKAKHFSKDYADGNGFAKLVKFIRDKDEHFDELPDYLKDVFGNSKETYLNYFLQRFPFIVVFLFYNLQSVESRNVNHFHVYDDDNDLHQLLYRFEPPSLFNPTQN